MTEAMDHESPGLELFKPNLEPRQPTPPPFARQSQSPGSNEAKHLDKDKDPHNNSRQLHLQVGHAAATASLLQYSAPNNPELWRYEKEYPLTVDPPVFGHGSYRALRPDSAKFSKRPELVKPDLIKVSEQALDLLPDTEGPLPPLENKRTLPPPSELVEVSQAPRAPSNGQLERSPSSPLSKFLINAPESRNSLPKLRDPTRARSPVESTTRLPPIQTQLGPVLPPPNGPPLRPVGTPSYSIPPTLPPSLPPVSAVSPPLTRVDPSPREPYRLAPLQPPPKIPPSPYSHLSPASSQAISAVSSPVSTQTYWRSTKPSIPYPYDPPSAASTRSPALNYPTPIERTSTGGCDPGGYTPSPQGTLPSAPTGTFKCSHPGCNAAPFQTQYLLNSHANVHSQDRPHFCPVEGCSRGPGGKGFKRKNEMIRHGLVHNSPGYICPFCPEQQHKYPRPDNLQRHVRVHHVDKNKDDPALRHVLAQRPEGSGRGRRRRLNPQ